MSRLTILFASQTGNAEDFAENMWRGAKQRNVPVLLKSFDEFGAMNLINENFVVFLCSTTGQGEEPDNMKNVWKFLRRRNLPSTSLENLKFAVVGFGDSSYSKFNFVAKKLFRRLRQLSAVNFLDLALADDQDVCGSNTVTDVWTENFWNALPTVWTEFSRFAFNLPSPAVENLPPKFKIRLLNEADNFSEFKNGAVDSNAVVKYANLLENQRLTPIDHFQDTRLIRLDIRNCDLEYEPGDVVVVTPANLPESVDLFTEICDTLNFGELFVLESNDSSFSSPPKYMLSQPCTFLDCLKNYFDLQAVPRRSFFEKLSYFADDEREKEKLLEFCDPKNVQDLYDYCDRPRRSVVEVLLDFSNTAKNVPIERWFDLLNSIRPRSFSIASSPIAHKGEIHVLLAVVKYKTKLAKLRLGLCSNWLAALKIGSEIPIRIQKGTFRYDQLSPLLMIGPGTGVAPFRSLIHTKYSDSTKNDFLNTPVPDVLFFGCRNAKSDFYFEREWHELEAKRCLKCVFAFSRDQDRKIYVQHKIEENDKLIAEFIMEKKCYVFVAGNSKQMPKDVQEALKCAVKKYYSLDDNAVDNLFEKMENQNRYQTETWS